MNRPRPQSLLVQAGPIDVPDAILAAQERGELVVFAGAGVSMDAPSNLPGFYKLVADLAKGTGVTVDENRLDITLGLLADAKIKIHEEVRTIIANPASRPNRIHQLLLNLFPDPKNIRIVTTNFDRHFTTAARELQLTVPEFRAPALPRGHDFRGIVHLHGSVDEEARSLILSDEDFGRAYLFEAWATDFLRELFRTYTVLFIGYRHSDPPIQYLARGMSAHGMKPRFAFTDEKNAALWKPFRITPVFYPVVERDHSALVDGVARWIEIVCLEPLEIEERVSKIVTAPESQAPDRSQTDFLRRCVSKSKTSHYFVQHARQFRWLLWLHEEKLLKPLLEETNAEIPEDKRRLVDWAGRRLVRETSGRGLRLLRDVGGRLNAEAWHAAAQELWASDDIDLADKGSAQWVIVLADSGMRQPHPRLLGYLFEKLAKGGQWNCALHVLGVLLSTRLQIDVEPSTRSVPEADKTAELGIHLVGKSADIQSAWHEHCRPALRQLSADLLPLLEDRLRAAERDYVLHGLPLERLLYGRRFVTSRLERHDRGDPAVIIDYLADVVDDLAANDPQALEGKARDWLHSRSPAFVRFGLHALSVSRMPAPEKLTLLRRHDLIFPDVEDARAETLLVLNSAYGDLTDEERRDLWKTIEAGPSAHWSRNLTDNVEEERQREIKKLVAKLSEGKSDVEALDARARVVGDMPQASSDRGDEEWTWGHGDKSPRSSAELLAQPAAGQLDFILQFKGKWPESSEGLAAAVATAAKENAEWAEGLLRALAERDAWHHPVWHRVFWQLDWKKLSLTFQHWLVDILVANEEQLEELASPARMIFDGETFEPMPEPALLEKLLETSIRWWPKLHTDREREKDSDAAEEWTSRAINSALGRVVEFWVRYIDHSRPDRTLSPGALPERLAPYFDQLAAAKTYSEKLGLAIIAQRLGFMRFVAPDWTKAKLYPWLDVEVMGDASFVVWKPLIFYGRFDRNLILELPPYFQKAFARFAKAAHQMAQRFVIYVAVIVHSRLWNVKENQWLDAFLLAMPLELRAYWAEQIGEFLDEVSPDERAAGWRHWIQRYWLERLSGRPCPLEREEMVAMMGWVRTLTHIPEMWEFANQMEFEADKEGEVLWELEHGKMPEEETAGLVQFLDWYMPRLKTSSYTLDSVPKVVERLPPRAAFRPTLRRVAQELSRLAYGKAREFAEMVETRFVDQT